MASLWLAAPPSAADLRFGYIDSSRIFQEYADAKEAQQRFDRLVQGWRDEAAEKEKAVTQLRQEVRDQSPILSAMKRQEKETALQRAVERLRVVHPGCLGAQRDAPSQENDRATAEIVQQIRLAVEKVAAGKALEVVLDAVERLPRLRGQVAGHHQRGDRGAEREEAARRSLGRDRS